MTAAAAEVEARLFPLEDLSGLLNALSSVLSSSSKDLISECKDHLKMFVKLTIIRRYLRVLVCVVPRLKTAAEHTESYCKHRKTSEKAAQAEAIYKIIQQRG